MNHEHWTMAKLESIRFGKRKNVAKEDSLQCARIALWKLPAGATEAHARVRVRGEILDFMRSEDILRRGQRKAGVCAVAVPVFEQDLVSSETQLSEIIAQESLKEYVETRNSKGAVEVCYPTARGGIAPHEHCSSGGDRQRMWKIRSAPDGRPFLTPVSLRRTREAVQRACQGACCPYTYWGRRKSFVNRRGIVQCREIGRDRGWWKSTICQGEGVEKCS